MRAIIPTVLLVLVSSSAYADVADERVLLGLGSPGCAGSSSVYDLVQLFQNPDGTTSASQSWSVPVGAILEITDIEFESPLTASRQIFYVLLYVVNRWSPWMHYTAWQMAYGNRPLAMFNQQTGMLSNSTSYVTEQFEKHASHFTSGILINAAGKPCVSLPVPINDFANAHLRIRGRLHPDDDLIYPPPLEPVDRAPR